MEIYTTRTGNYFDSVMPLFNVDFSLFFAESQADITEFRPSHAILQFIVPVTIFFNSLPHMAILGSSNSAANKDMMSKNTGKWGYRLSRKHCGKRRNCSLRAISPCPKMFSKAVCF